MTGAAAATALAGLLAPGCSSSGTEQVVVTVDQAVTLADQQVHLKISGLRPHKPVTVGAEAVDQAGKKWHGEVTFTSDDHGRVDLDTAEPSGGSYQGVDGMGLFWSMNPSDGDPEAQSFVPRTENGRPVEQVGIFVSRGGKRVASTTVTRQWMSSGVTAEQLTTAKDNLTGMYVAPAADDEKHPAVLLFGGSEGGVASPLTAALLASHGYPVLDVAYFHADGLPAELRNIPLEYFASAAQWLDKQPGVDPAHVIVMSASRGTEAALLLSDHFPALLHGAVLFAPGAAVSDSFPRPDGSAWTYRGQPVPRDPIAVDSVDGPVLAVAGSDDLLWGSRLAAQLIMSELDQASNRFPHKAIVVDGAGHQVAGAPYLPHGTKLKHPIVGKALDYGGSRAANESALRQGWAQVLVMLSSLR